MAGRLAPGDKERAGGRERGRRRQEGREEAAPSGCRARGFRVAATTLAAEVRGVRAAPPLDPPGFRLLREVCEGSRFIPALDVHRAIMCTKAWGHLGE